MPKEGPRWNLHASGASSCDSRYLLSPAWGDCREVLVPFWVPGGLLFFTPPCMCMPFFIVDLLGKAYAMPKEGPRWNLHASGASSCDSRYLLSPAWGDCREVLVPFWVPGGLPFFTPPCMCMLCSLRICLEKHVPCLKRWRETHLGPPTRQPEEKRRKQRRRAHQIFLSKSVPA